MKPKNSTSLQLPLPTPPEKKRRASILLCLVILLLIGGSIGAFWFSRSPEVQKNIIAASQDALKSAIDTRSLDPIILEMRKHVLPEISSFLDDVETAVLELKNLAQKTVNPSQTTAPVVIAPLPSIPGTLSGQNIQAPVAPAVKEAEKSEANVDAPAGAVAPKVKEDTVVRPAFLEDMARWMVSRYRPGKAGGSIVIGVQAANMRYGVGMHGLAQGEDPISGRMTLLRYAFNAPMLDALYNLYVDQFMEVLAGAATDPQNSTALSPDQINDMYHLYSTKFAAASGTMRGIAAVGDLKKRLQEMETLAQKTVESHRALSEAVFALDEARERQDEARINTAQMRVDGSNARYRKSLEDRTAAQNALLQAIKRESAGRALDDDSILFLAFWLDRRMERQEDAASALSKAGHLLQDLSMRLSKAAGANR